MGLATIEAAFAGAAQVPGGSKNTITKPCLKFTHIILPMPVFAAFTYCESMYEALYNPGESGYCPRNDNK